MTNDKKFQYCLQKIKQLKRDIKIIDEILQGIIDNYTKFPLLILKESKDNYQKELDSLKEQFNNFLLPERGD